MVEQTPCPVCTLYLHPGMNLADHLETHPKEQVIKALVALASTGTTSLSSPSSCGSTTVAAITAANAAIPTGSAATASQQEDSLFHAPTPPPPPPPLIQRGYPQLQAISSSPVAETTGFINSKESKNGYTPPSQRNVMIVNRQSTMVYQAGDHNQNILGQQIALAPPPLQLFNISSYNQGKFLTPPPAYGTAISQLRSQNNQSSNSYIRQNQSQLGNHTTSYCSVLDQNAVDYTVTKNISRHNPTRQFQQQQQQQFTCLAKNISSLTSLPTSASELSTSSSLLRRSTSPKRMPSFSPRLEQSVSPSPSVLRFAESPVTAHYVERDNGDFIVQETPRHIVECVEKDDGEFSVTEKVIHSPPSVVQFHEDHEDEENDNQDNEIQDQNESESNVLENHDENDIDKSSKIEIMDQDYDLLTCTNNDDIEMNKENDYEDEEEEELREIEENRPQQYSKQRKTVSGLTVISNVKLNANESLDLMENIMASSNNNEVEVLWSGIVNPIIEKIEQEDIKAKRCENANKDTENKTEEDNEDDKLNQDCVDEIPLKTEKCLSTVSEILKINGKQESDKIQSTSSSSSVVTSVIRLASTPISISSAIEIIKLPEQIENEICPPIKKEIENTLSPAVSAATASVTATSFKPNYVRETTKRPFRKTPKKLVVKFKNTPSKNAEQNESKQGPSRVTEVHKKSNSELNLKAEEKNAMEITIESETIQEQREEEEEDNESKIESLTSETQQIETKQEEKENDLVTIAPSIPAIQPMIVYESSLAEEPTISEGNYADNSNAANFPTNNDDKYTELSKLLDNCWKTTNGSQSKLNENSEKPIEELIETTVDISSDNNGSMSSSLQITENSVSNLESQPQKVNESSSSSSSSSSSTLISAVTISSVNSFPSTSNFSKPSTSSSALQQQERQTDNQNFHQPSQSQPLPPLPPNYSDYPFSFLYAANNNNNLDRNRLSPLYPTELWKNYNGPIFQSQTDFQDIEERERSSYIDLDALKKANSSDAVQYVEALNIRTDEKMPAKGEISEQESNGDVENSWSQPLGGEQPYRFFNHLENYVARESWSDEGFMCSQNVIEDIKPKPSLTPPSSSGEVAGSQGVSPVKKARKPRKIRSAAAATTTTVKKNKIFTCDHCPCTFPKLKDRNLHLIVLHDYKRVNRRLIREPPPATITSAEHQEQHQQLHQQAQQFLLEQQQVQQSIATSFFTEEGDNIVGEDVKPDTKVKIVQPTTTTTLGTSRTHLPRTKYDSIRAGVYRMLMDFNLSALKLKQNVEIDSALFESKTFCCFTCKENFVSVKQFDEHLAEHQAECFTCGRKFTRWSYFAIHLKRHIGWKDFECTHCSKKFVIRSALIEHMRMHTGISPLICKHCGKSFKRYSNLTQHKRLCHSTRNKIKKEYVCHCGEVLPSKARFIWHREIHDTKPKCCPYCRDRFIHSNSLRRHIRLVHSEKFTYDQPAECPICNQVYAKNSLKGHMSTHSMNVQHECAICNKSFSTKWNLKIHSWVHANRTAKPFKCDMCIKAFVREIDYKNHINAHKQIKPFTCEYCGCKFIRKYNYLRHRREHHGQKKFRCELCGKQFHRHYYLIEHRRTHTGERPFLCTICGKSSTTKTNHNKHLKIHHSRDPFTSET